MKIRKNLRPRSSSCEAETTAETMREMEDIDISPTSKKSAKDDSLSQKQE